MKIREVYRLISRNILKEGMDIHAFKKQSDEPAFRKACDTFADRIKGDNDARKKFGLTDLDKFKGDLDGFIKAVDDANDYIGKRTREKRIRKARNNNGVNVLFEDDDCIIVSPESERSARAAGSLIEKEDMCPWCIALSYPENAEHWKRYKTFVSLFFFKKTAGKAVDGWCMILTVSDCHASLSGKLSFSQLEDEKNAGNDGDKRAQAVIYRRMLKSLGKTNAEVGKIVADFLASKKNEIEKAHDIETMFAAVHDEDIATVAEMLGKGVDVNCIGENDSTPLIVACKEKSLEMCKLLIKNGANINAQNKWGMSPLHNAAFYENNDMCELLIKNGADIDMHATNYDGSTPLLQACDNKYRNSTTVELLLDAGADIDATDGNNGTAILRAVESNNIQIVKTLLKHGANTNIKTSSGSTPLTLAVLFLNTRIVELLVNGGADVNARGIYDMTPLEIATNDRENLKRDEKTTNNAKAIAKFLKSHGAH